MLPQLSLVLGGAASGKSAFAEGLAASAGLPMTYIATARAGDAEMDAKIALHRARRGGQWQTIEAAHGAAAALAALPAGRVALFDCATMWLMNQIDAGREPETEMPRLIEALLGASAPVVVVSNELGMGLVPEGALSRRFREAQGALNQTLAARAGLVVFVAAGLPVVLKGTLPAELTQEGRGA